MKIAKNRLRYINIANLIVLINAKKRKVIISTYWVFTYYETVNKKKNYFWEKRNIFSSILNKVQKVAII